MRRKDPVQAAADALEATLGAREREAPALRFVRPGRSRDRAAQERDAAYAPLELARYTKRVVLHEDSLALDGEALPLLPGLRATTEMQGITQTVQGWVFKSDHDRRRIFLHVTAPGFARTLDFPLSYSESGGAGIGSSTASTGEFLRGRKIMDPVGELMRIAHLATERASQGAGAGAARLERIVAAELAWQRVQVGDLETLRVRRDELAALLAAKQFLSAQVQRCEQLLQRADAALSAGGFGAAGVGTAGSLTRAGAAALGVDAAPAVCAWIERLGLRPDEEETVLVVLAGPLQSVPQGGGAAVVASNASVRLVTDASPRMWLRGSLPQVRRVKGDLAITDGAHEWRLGRVPEVDAERLVTLVELLERASIDVPVSPPTASEPAADRRSTPASSAGSTSLSAGDPLRGAHPLEKTAAASFVAELQQLAALHAAGALTEAEFVAAKRRLFGDDDDAPR